MKLYALLAVIFCACGITTISDAEGYCARCVEARENNEKNPNPYFYYEDYQEAQKQKH